MPKMPAIKQPIPSTKTIVFIYGSLLSGCSNHQVMGDARLVGEACTKPDYDLIDLGAYPALVKDGLTAVKGELYEVDEALLSTLDEFEGHPELYQRSAIVLDDGRQAQTYVMSRPQLWQQNVVHSGDWRAHRLEK